MDDISAQSTNPIARQVWESRFLVAFASLAGGVVAGASSFLVAPTFHAETLLAPVSEQSQLMGNFSSAFSGLADLAGLGSASQLPKITAIATLKSRTLTEAFIADRKILPMLFESKWDSSNSKWKSDDPDRIPELWDGFKVFNEKIRKVEEDRRTGLVTLSVDWTDPIVAADWANDLVRRLNEKTQRDAIAESERSIAYLQDQVSRAGEVNVRNSLYNLIELETKKAAIANARKDFAFKVIDPASPPRRKTSPKRVFWTMLGLVTGAMAAILFVILRKNAWGRDAHLC